MIRAVTLDLDDTLWAIEPVIARAEQALEAWLRTHCPRVAERYPVPAMRELRARLAAERPDLAHDFTAQRRLSLLHALTECEENLAHVDGAFEAFFAARNAVELFPEVEHALTRIRARVPVAALTNGNADLVRIGIGNHFDFVLGAREFGRAKPDAAIFLHACERLGCAPHEVLHVGDDPEFDVRGALAAGLRAAWINRAGARWPHDDGHAPAADLIFADLQQLAVWIDNHTIATAPATVALPGESTA